MKDFRLGYVESTIRKTTSDCPNGRIPEAEFYAAFTDVLTG